MILSCRPRTEYIPVLSKFPEDATYSAIISGDQAILKASMHRWRRNGMLDETAIGKCVLYAFLTFCSGEVDDNTVRSELFKLVNLMLATCADARDAAALIEMLFDHVRFDCHQTSIFVLLVISLWRCEKRWNEATIQDIIVSTITSRRNNVTCVPQGVEDIHRQLSLDPQFLQVARR